MFYKTDHETVYLILTENIRTQTLRQIYETDHQTNFEEIYRETEIKTDHETNDMTKIDKDGMTQHLTDYDTEHQMT